MNLKTTLRNALLAFGCLCMTVPATVAQSRHQGADRNNVSRQSQTSRTAPATTITAPAITITVRATITTVPAITITDPATTITTVRDTTGLHMTVRAAAQTVPVTIVPVNTIVLLMTVPAAETTTVPVTATAMFRLLRAPGRGLCHLRVGLLPAVCHLSVPSSA